MGDDDNCKAPSTATYRCEGMLVRLCALCGQQWEADGDWSLVPLVCGEGGQSLVEFALVLPLFVLLVSGLVGFGTFLLRQNTAAELATIVCRDASIHGAAHARASGAGLAQRLGLPSASILVAVDPLKRRVTTTVLVPYRALVVRVPPVRAERVMAMEGGAL